MNRNYYILLRHSKYFLQPERVSVQRGDIILNRNTVRCFIGSRRIDNATSAVAIKARDKEGDTGKGRANAVSI